LFERFGDSDSADNSIGWHDQRRLYAGCLNKIGQHDAALAQLEIVLADETATGATLLRCADVFLVRQAFDRAEDCLRLAESRDADECEAALRWVEVDLARSKPARAADRLQALLDRPGLADQFRAKAGQLLARCQP
jgi:hypothetical protein